MDNTILSIIGTFIGIGLALNAYFIKGLLESILRVEKNSEVFAGIQSEKMFQVQIRVQNLEEERRDFYQRLNTLERGK